MPMDSDEDRVRRRDSRSKSGSYSSARRNRPEKLTRRRRSSSSHSRSRSRSRNYSRHKSHRRNRSYSRSSSQECDRKFNKKHQKRQHSTSIRGGKWENEEKYVDFGRIKTEPVSDEELEIDKNSCNVKPDIKPSHIIPNIKPPHVIPDIRKPSHMIPKIKPPDEKPDIKADTFVKKEERERWGKEEATKPEKKEGVNLGLSGKLDEDTNTYNGVVIAYSQPPEARKPKRRWRWYIFKDDQEIPFLPLHRQSAYLIGRNRKVADIPIDHPSCSKQHAVLQYRLVSYRRLDGSIGRTVKPYIYDLDSANGTCVNTKRISSKQYVELSEKDVVKFGFSSREYVLLHEGSKDSNIEEVDSGPEQSPVSLLRS